MKNLRAIVFLMTMSFVGAACAATLDEQLLVKALNHKRQIVSQARQYQVENKPIPEDLVQQYKVQDDIIQKYAATKNKKFMEHIAAMNTTIMGSIAKAAEVIKALENALGKSVLTKKESIAVSNNQPGVEKISAGEKAPLLPAVEKPAPVAVVQSQSVSVSPEKSGELLYDVKTGKLKKDGIKQLIENIKKNSPDIKKIKLIVTTYNQAAEIVQAIKKIKTLDKELSGQLMQMIHDAIAPTASQLPPKKVSVQDATIKNVQPQLEKAPKQAVTVTPTVQTVGATTAPAPLSPTQEALFHDIKGGLEALTQFLALSMQDPMSHFDLRQEWLQQALQAVLHGKPLTSDNVASIQDELSVAADKLVKELLRKDRVVSAGQWAQITSSIKKQVADFMGKQPQEKVIKHAAQQSLNKAAFEAFVKESEKDDKVWFDGEKFEIKEEWIDKALKAYLGSMSIDKNNLSVLLKEIPDAASNLMISYAQKDDDDTSFSDIYLELGAVADGQVEKYIRNKYSSLVDTRNVVLPFLK